MLTKKILECVKSCIKCLLDATTDKELTTEGETKRMYEEFNKRRMYFLERNSKRVIEEIFIPQIRKEFLKETRLLITDEQALLIAVERFQLYMHMGKIDEMNNLIGVEN